jgi:hypothetical protein
MLALVSLKSAPAFFSSEGRSRNHADHGQEKQLSPDELASLFQSGRTGTGADLTKRTGAPMVAVMVFYLALELFIYPAIYPIWKWRTGHSLDIAPDGAWEPSTRSEPQRFRASGAEE